jgi:hypothetical protein
MHAKDRQVPSLFARHGCKTSPSTDSTRNELLIDGQSWSFPRRLILSAVPWPPVGPKPGGWLCQGTNGRKGYGRERLPVDGLAQDMRKCREQNSPYQSFSPLANATPPIA